MKLDIKKVKDEMVAWIRTFFEENGRGCRAVVGISGGKDSSVTAAICAEALGKENVVGVLMPCGEQPDIDAAFKLAEHLGIEYYVVNIGGSVEALRESVPEEIKPTRQAVINLSPRIRMSALYYVSQCLNGRVANTCNLSEDYVGYSTRYGDSVGDFSPLSNLTVTEVKELGALLGLPDELVNKVPSDGLSGRTDEDNLGFTYDTLDRYIRTGVCENAGDREKIDGLHRKNLFKLELMPSYRPSEETYEKCDV